jgi:hypothetical protein
VKVEVTFFAETEADEAHIQTVRLALSLASNLGLKHSAVRGEENKALTISYAPDVIPSDFLCGSLDCFTHHCGVCRQPRTDDHEKNPCVLKPKPLTL